MDRQEVEKTICGNYMKNAALVDRFDSWSTLKKGVFYKGALPPMNHRTTCCGVCFDLTLLYVT